jgi:hypothetical protein
VVGRAVRDPKPDSPRSCWGVRCTSRLHLPCAKLISLRSHPYRGSCRSTYSRPPHYPCRHVAHEYQSPRDEGTPTEVGKLSAHVKPKVFFEHHSASKYYLPGSSQIHVLRTKSIERETAIENKNRLEDANIAGLELGSGDQEAGEKQVHEEVKECRGCLDRKTHL